MFLLLNERSQKLLDLLLQIPPKMEDAENLIKLQKYTSEELTGVAINYAKKSSFDVSDAILIEEMEPPTNPSEIIEGCHSTHLYEVLDLLLQYGADVNTVLKSDTSSYNLMSAVMWVDNGYVAADSMRLLLENGGNPNLIVDDESIYDNLNFDIWFGAIEQENRCRYDHWVHTWFVLLAFGAEDPNGSLFKEYDKEEIFSLNKLKDHRNYDFCLSRGENGPVLRIFDKKTFWEVACF